MNARKTQKQIDKEKMCVVYNGVTVQVLYIGNTKYGLKAHLMRTNGDKFFVNADKVIDRLFIVEG
jgi:hypothetical protein